MDLGFTFGEYSNEELGVIAVYFGTQSGGVLHEGMKTDLVLDKSAKSNEYEIISQKNKEPQSFIFQIVNEDGSDIEQEQERFLHKVMCKNGVFDWLFFHEERYSDIWIKANMRNPQAWTVRNVKGMQFEVTTSSPYVFTDERELNYSITDTSDLIDDLYINTDAEEPIYPDIEITMLEAGNITITNANEIRPGYITTINNLVVGEVINIKNQKISSSVPTHNVFNDTNKKWLRFYDGYNQISVNLKCQINIKYREFRKMVIF